MSRRARRHEPIRHHRGGPQSKGIGALSFSFVEPDEARTWVNEKGVGSLRGAIGTPNQVRDLLRSYEEVGVDQVIFVSQTGNTRHEHICESLELFAREVMPEFAERADEREKAKLDHLAPAMEAALARREPPRDVPDTVLKNVFMGS